MLPFKYTETGGPWRQVSAACPPQGLQPRAGACYLGLVPPLPCACSLSLTRDGFSADGQAWCPLQRRHGGWQCRRPYGWSGRAACHAGRPRGGPGSSGVHLVSAAAGCVAALSLGPVGTGTLKCVAWRQHSVATVVTRNRVLPPEPCEATEPDEPAKRTWSEFHVAGSRA